MNIPNLPNRNVSLVDPSNKNQMHPLWHNFFDQLLTQLQQNVSQEGFNLPEQTTSNIALLQTGSPDSRTMIYNNTTHKYMVQENGTFKTITTS